MKENVIVEKSYAFALRIVKLAKKLREMKEHVFADQILRCGTSIGANLAEGQAAQTRPDFAYKIGISYKESCECHYWLRLLGDSETLPAQQLEPLKNECYEILRILSSIQRTIKGTEYHNGALSLLIANC